MAGLQKVILIMEIHTTLLYLIPVSVSHSVFYKHAAKDCQYVVAVRILCHKYQDQRTTQFNIVAALHCIEKEQL